MISKSIELKRDQQFVSFIDKVTDERRDRSNVYVNAKSKHFKHML